MQSVAHSLWFRENERWTDYKVNAWELHAYHQKNQSYFDHKNIHLNANHVCEASMGSI